MPLSREDILRAVAGGPIEIPDAAFGPFVDPDVNPDHPELRRAVEWFRGFIAPADWARRRKTAFLRLHAAAMGEAAGGGKGRFFDDSDAFGWYLFLAEASLDHPWNYEPMYGSRVVPPFAAIGRSLEALRAVPGVEDRVRRMVGPERGQPNGGVFELLVAAAYIRAGAKVAFRPERPGTAKSWDLDVALDGRELAVECKRLETSAYGEGEREGLRALWGPASALAQSAALSVFAEVAFLVPLAEVPQRHLIEKVANWSRTPRTPLTWSDGVSRGRIADLDLAPLRKVLETDEVLIAGTRAQELLTGSYVRHANHLQTVRYKGGMSPRYMSACDLAIVLRWSSISAVAIAAKARDVLTRLASANRQLPDDRPGIVHIGFEAVEGDEVEIARFEKILESTGRFDPQGKPLEYVYCHYLVPESPPDGGWAFDETVQWRKLGATPAPRPLTSPFLVLPEEAATRDGPHWRC